MADRKTTEQFIADATMVHGGKYDYSRVNYVRAIEKVEIICRDHGSFMQSPNKHLSSAQGCKLCGAITQGAKNSIGVDAVIERFRIKHGDKYEYDISSYVLTNKPMRIMCSAHGWFEQTPDAHYASKLGCKKCSTAKCAQEKSYDTSVYIEKARSVHGDRYSYDLTSFVRSGLKVKIICKTHGVFEQSASHHLNGYGCQSCAKNGFNVNSGAHLYVLESKCKSMIKVGVTKNLRQRVMSLTSCTPFEFDLVAHYSGKGRYIKDDESRYHGELMSCEISGFNGASEWFRYDHEIVERIKKRAEALF